MPPHWRFIKIFIILAFTDIVFIWNLVSFEAPRPSDAQATSAYSALIILICALLLSSFKYFWKYDFIWIFIWITSAWNNVTYTK